MRKRLAAPTLVAGIAVSLVYMALWREGDAVVASAQDERPFIVGGPTGQSLAQTLAAPVAGVLTDLQLAARCSSGNLVVEIRDAHPTGRRLARGAAGSEALSGAGATVAIPLDGLPRLQSGQRVALVLRTDGLCEVDVGGAGQGQGCVGGWFRDDTWDDGDWQPLAPGTNLFFRVSLTADAQKVVLGFNGGTTAEDDDTETQSGATVKVQCFLSIL